MNNLSIALLTVAVIVIAAWLAGWLPSWLASRLPASPLHEGFEAPPTAADPMRPTEAETLAYLKYAIQKAVKPLDFSETEALMDRAFESVADDKSTLGWHKQWRMISDFIREVYNPRLISRNLVEHPVYKAVMEAQSADELMKKIIAAKELFPSRSSQYDLEALNDFKEALEVRSIGADSIPGKYHPQNTGLSSFIKDELYYPLRMISTKICESGKAQQVFGSSADAVCQAALNYNSLMPALSSYSDIYREALIINSVSNYITYVNLYVETGHTSYLYRIPSWYLPPRK